MLVGAGGLEPPAPASQTRCATGLRYAPSEMSIMRIRQDRQVIAMFPMLYHAHHERHPEDQKFWLDLAERQGGKILELGCGTGRVLLKLAEAGFGIYGLDRDAQMLRYLKSISPLPLQSRVSIFQADICAYRLALEFSLILLPCNTYTTLSSIQRGQTLRRVYHHLHPDGIFAVSMPNPNLLDNLPGKSEFEIEEIFPHPLDGEPVQVSSAWRRIRDRIVFTWHYDHLLPDGSVERITQDIVHHIIPFETIMGELNSAGLDVIEMFGDFDGTPYSYEAPYLVLIARQVKSGHF